MPEPKFTQIGIVLSAGDAEALKRATLHLREQLGPMFNMTDGPICEAGVYEVNCSFGLLPSSKRPDLVLVQGGRTRGQRSHVPDANSK